MKFQFDNTLSLADVIAILLSITSITIHFVQWIWNKWFLKANLNYDPIGQATLFFNQSAAYIRIKGAFECENKAVLIKQVNLTITRRKDGTRLNFSWSSFISTTNYRVIGNQLTPTDIAHPLRIEADSVIPVGIEFADPSDSFGRTFAFKSKALFAKIPSIVLENRESYERAKELYQSFAEYSELRNLLYKEFFWDVGHYDLDIEVRLKKSSKHFLYETTVNEQDNETLIANIDESLLAPLKNCYNILWDFHTPSVELREVH